MYIYSYMHVYCHMGTVKRKVFSPAFAKAWGYKISFIRLSVRLSVHLSVRLGVALTFILKMVFSLTLFFFYRLTLNIAPPPSLSEDAGSSVDPTPSPSLSKDMGLTVNPEPSPTLSEEFGNGTSVDLESSPSLHVDIGSSVDPATMDQQPLLGGGCPIYTTDPLTVHDILEALRNPDNSKVSDVPPIKPKAGDTYVIDSQTQQDWTCDQYQWVQVGKTRKEIEDDALVKIYFSIRIPGVKEGKGRARPNFSSKFKRNSYTLESNPSRVLVTYEGDEKLYVPLPHGNSKKESAVEREYVKTCKSVLNEIKQSHAKPMIVRGNTLDPISISDT